MTGLRFVLAVDGAQRTAQRFHPSRAWQHAQECPPRIGQGKDILGATYAEQV